MPNQFTRVNWVTMESLRMLLNKLEVAQFYNRSLSREFQKEFAVGDTIQVKLPQRFIIRDGLGYQPQPIDRKTTPVTLDQIFGVDFEWDSVEKALDMERGQDIVKREYIDPAMAQIAQEIDSRAAFYAYRHTNNIVGALGTTPNTLATYLAADTRMFQLSCTPGDKGMIVSPAMNATIAAALTTLTNPASSISRLYKEGSMGRAAGFDWYRSNSLYSHTAGTWAGAVTIAAVPAQGASSITITGGAGDTFNVGDVISIANVNAVNPSTRRTVGFAKQFVVTQALVATGGNDTLQISPIIYGPNSQYQNVDALPQIGAALTLFPGTVNPNGLSGINGLALNRDAFALVGVKLEMPKAVEVASQTRDPETGLSVRFIRQFDGRTSQMINRFDVLCGFGSLYPDNCAVRVASLL